MHALNLSIKVKISSPNMQAILLQLSRIREDSYISNAAEIDCRMVFYVNRGERVRQLFQQPDIITTGIDEVSTTAKPLVRQIRKLPAKLKKLMEMIPHQEAWLQFIFYSSNFEESLSTCFLNLISACVSFNKRLSSFPLIYQINEEEASLFDMLWLLLASVIFVPTFQKIPGGMRNDCFVQQALMIYFFLKKWKGLRLSAACNSPGLLVIN